MKTLVLAMFGLLALANAAPQYGHDNCKVEWRSVKKAGYKEVTEYKETVTYETVCNYVYETSCKNVKVPYTEYVTECTTDTTNQCTDQWVCLDYPKPASLKQCFNKKWQATGDCKNIYVDNCKDVPKTLHKYEEKCEQKKVQKCEDVPKTVVEEIHKRVPTQIEEKVAYRVCPGQSDHELDYLKAKVTILSNTNANGINGEVIFSQEEVNSPLKVTGLLKNLPPGLHGFHVHEKRHTGNDCSTAGGHFNPSKSDHGSRISNVRHAGDFGNIEANANGEANIDFSIETGRYLSTLFGENSLSDRSLVIHELEDVFAQPTGAAGSRLACGVLEKS